MSKKLLFSVAFIVLVAAGCNSTASTNTQSSSANTQEQGVMVGGALMVPSKNIIDNASAASNVTTLVAAVQAAGLTNTLSGPGPFTVFAPTNDAFNKLPAGTVNTLLEPANKAQLVDILTYHVVSGRYTTADLQDGMTLTTVEGKTLKISKNGSTIMINGVAMIQTPDVISSNGVTHVIDTVLTPPTGVEVGGALMVPSLDIVSNAMNASNVTTLVAAVKAAGLVPTLQGPGPFTVFAPTNDAFNKLPAGTVNTLLEPANKVELAKILEYHVVAGKYLESQLTNGLVLKTVEGDTLKFTVVNNQVMINGVAMIQTPDVISTNGVTHVIDTVLMPPAGM